MMRTILAALALLLGAPLLRADVVVLVNGDRVTGRVVGKITRRVRAADPLRRPRDPAPTRSSASAATTAARRC